jgi:hypothetical protein
MNSDCNFLYRTPSPTERRKSHSHPSPPPPCPRFLCLCVHGAFVSMASAAEVRRPTAPQVNVSLPAPSVGLDRGDDGLGPATAAVPSSPATRRRARARCGASSSSASPAPPPPTTPSPPLCVRVSTPPRPCTPPPRPPPHLLPRLRQQSWTRAAIPFSRCCPSPALAQGRCPLLPPSAPPQLLCAGRTPPAEGEDVEEDGARGRCDATQEDGVGGRRSAALENAFEERGMTNLHRLSPLMQFASYVCVVRWRGCIA